MATSLALLQLCLMVKCSQISCVYVISMLQASNLAVLQLPYVFLLFPFLVFTKSQALKLRVGRSHNSVAKGQTLQTEWKTEHSIGQSAVVGVRKQNFSKPLLWLAFNKVTQKSTEICLLLTNFRRQQITCIGTKGVNNLEMSRICTISQEFFDFARMTSLSKGLYQVFWSNDPPEFLSFFQLLRTKVKI